MKMDTLYALYNIGHSNLDTKTLGRISIYISLSSSSCSWRVRSVILFLNPQDEVGPSTSSLVVPCPFVLSVYIVMLVLVVYLCPSSVRVVATFSGIVLFPFLSSVLLFFPLIHWFFSLSSFVIPSKCLKNFICAASKRCSSLLFSTQNSLPNLSAALAVMLWISLFYKTIKNARYMY